MEGGGTLRERAIVALREGQVEKAIDLLSRVVVADDTDADSSALLGIAYSQAGHHDQAKRALKMATELQPENSTFHFNLGLALERAADMGSAADAYRETLRLNPRHPQAQARLAALGVAYQPPPAPRPSPPVAAPPPVLQQQQAPSVFQQPAAPAAAPPPGLVACPACRQWSRPGFLCETCSAPLPAPPPVTPASRRSMAEMSAPLNYTADMGSGEAFFRRLAAVFIDGMVVGLPMAIIMVAVVFGAAGQSGAPEAAIQGIVPVLYGLSYVLYILYCSTMLCFYGRTLGKMALGICVVGPDGGPPGWLRAFGRETIGRFLSYIVCYLGFLWMLWDADQKTFHDHLFGTEVLRA